MELSVISPTYNEADNITALIAALEESLEDIDYEILICDDDSPDKTWQRVEEIGRCNPRVRVLRRTRDRGLAPAVVEGFTKARGDVVACIDADLQHNPAILSKMLAELRNGCDLVVGSRYIPGGGTGEWNWLRRLQSWVATKMAQWLLGVELHDPMSGYFMLRRSKFLDVHQSLNTNGYKILLEFAAHLKPSQVCEVPYIFRARTRGESKLSSRIILCYLRQLWSLSGLAKVLPPEFVTFAAVGGIGVVVNLGVMALILHLTSYRDWRASAMASLVATVNNYVLNNSWTFRNRSHSGITFIGRYIYYLLASLVGLAATTASYGATTWAIGRILGLSNASAMLHETALLLCQFCAILVGTLFNFTLNRTITWPVPRDAASAQRRLQAHLSRANEVLAPLEQELTIGCEPSIDDQPIAKS